MKELRKKVAVITGGSRGIGRACCVAFARQGANIVFTYNKNSKSASALAKELKEYNVKVKVIRADVRNYNECQLVIKKTLNSFGRIDILINNAGIVKDKALFHWHLNGQLVVLFDLLTLHLKHRVHFFSVLLGFLLFSEVV